MKIIVYKAYVIALLALVVWAAQFIHSLIYWEFEYTGVEKPLRFNKDDSPMQKLAKMRGYFDNHIATRNHDLGDIVFEEHYEEGHFHHVGQRLTEPAVNGCDYCHTVVAHSKDEEARAFRNMHGYFIACETCHYDRGVNLSSIEYRWIRVAEDKVVEEPIEKIKQSLSDKKTLEKAKRRYGDARISPWLRKRDGKLYSILGNSNLSEARSIMRNFKDISSLDLRKNMDRIHRKLTKKPMECDACHTRKGAKIPYRELGYSEEETLKLEDTEVASVISKYNKFHFPNLFIRKDDRNRDNGDMFQ